MRRAGRILYNLLTTISLLLLLATVTVGVRSYWVSDAMRWNHWSSDNSFLDERVIVCSYGGIELGSRRFAFYDVRPAGSPAFNYYRGHSPSYPVYGDSIDQYFIEKPRRYALVGFEWIPEATNKSKPPAILAVHSSNTATLV